MIDTGKDIKTWKLYSLFSHGLMDNMLIYFALIFFLVSKQTLAQQHKNDVNKLPATITRWINSKLAKSFNKAPIDYNSSLFFKPDTAHLIGYIKGYNPGLGFSTGIVYVSNELTWEEVPIVIKIYPDGRFEGNLPLIHPKYLNFLLNDQYIFFYAEPGQTIGMIISWDEFLAASKHHGIKYQFKDIVYCGPLAKVNKDLAGFKNEQFDYQYFVDNVEMMTPDDIKNNVRLSTQKRMQEALDYIANNSISPQAATILKNRVLLEGAMHLFDYVMRQRNKNPILPNSLKDAKYYDFLKNISLNDRSLLVDNHFDSFINRLEYSAPMITQMWHANSWLGKWHLKDSVAKEMMGLSSNLAYDITKIRALKYQFEGYKSKAAAVACWDSLKISITEPYLIKTGNYVLNKAFPDKQSIAYRLPDNTAGQIFRKIIEPYKGKILFVDFWATTCGPCVYNIEQMKPDRDKYKGNKDFDFIFITDERASPAANYAKFVKEQDLEHTVRLSNDQFNYLRQLFKFNGIPHYVVINNKGDVLNDDFPMSNFKNELSKVLSVQND